LIERFIDLLVQFWSAISPFFVVNEFEAAIVLRLGRYHRSIAVGFHWKWPLAEHVMSVDTVIQIMHLPTQTLLTSDHKSVIVSAIVKYQIRDAKSYILQIMHDTDVLQDTAQGAIKQAIADHGLAQIADIEDVVLRKVRRAVNAYGFKIHSVTFVDLGPIKSFRILRE